MTVQINGTSGITTPGITTDTSVANTSSTLTGESLNRIKTYTAQATTSGTSIVFPSIPSWAKKVILMYSGVKTNGTSYVSIQLGTSSGFKNTGYDGSFVAPVSGSPTVGAATTSGWALTANQSNTEYRYGVCTLFNMGNNLWSMVNIGAVQTVNATIAGGSVQLPSTLDKLQIYTLNGTDTFTNGLINIIVEG